MTSPDELSGGPESLTVPNAGFPAVSGEEFQDAELTVLDEVRPQAPLVLDASFVLAVLEGEPAAMRLVDLLRGSVLLSPTAGEVYLRVAERSGLEPAQVEAVLLAYGVRLVDLPVAATHHFPKLRRIISARRQESGKAGQRPLNFSLVDLCVLGYAYHLGFAVLTGHRHWATLADHGLATSVHLYQRNLSVHAE